MAIDTLWLSGLLSSKERTAIEISWRNRLGRAGQSFIELHRYAYAEAERRGQREAVDREAREVVTILDEEDADQEDDNRIDDDER